MGLKSGDPLISMDEIVDDSLLFLAGWIHRRQQEAVEYLLAENRVLREKLGKKRILLNDDQQRRLAVKGKILGRKMLEQLATIVTKDTILPIRRCAIFLKRVPCQQAGKED